MNKNLFNYLICPEDGKKLDFVEYEGNCISGILKCSAEHYYPIFHDVPVIIKNGELLEFFDSNEKSEFSRALESLKINFASHSSLNYESSLLKQTSLNWSKQWEEDKLENTIWGSKETFLEHIPLSDELLGRSKFILEIGCGNGRNIGHVKRGDNFIFAVDISSSAYYARQRYGGDNNVFLIRCDANHLPFNNDFFDLVFSDHVLQHIYGMEDCFGEIKRVSKQENTFVFNLYSAENNFLMIRIFEPFKAILKRLPVGLLSFLSGVPAFILWLAMKSIYLPINRYAPGLYKWLPLSGHFTFWISMKYKTLKTICFDLLHAPVVNYCSGNDIDKLSQSVSLKFFSRHLLRQTLWVCAGKFIKNQQ